jgi:hypothetical protein
MNSTIISSEKLKRLKELVLEILTNKEEIEYLDNVIFIQQNFRLDLKQGKRKKELKKINRKHQKEINETIKNL